MGCALGESVAVSDRGMRARRDHRRVMATARAATGPDSDERTCNALVRPPPDSNRISRAADVTTIIRDATPADVPHIHRLLHGLAEYEGFLDQFTATEADFRDRLFGAEPAGHVLLAVEAAGPPVGIALFYYTFSTFACRRNMFLEDLFVEPAWRKRGLGLALLRALARRAVAQGCGRIDWHVLNWNEPSIAFYASLGATRMTDWHVRQLRGDALKALAEGDSNA
jgi:GNAT superfamily N-acetyltransferase